MKNLMTKIASLLLVLCMCVSLVVYADAAESIIELNTTFDMETYSLNVSGDIKSDIADISMILEVTKDGKTVDAQQMITAAPVVNGKVAFAFEAISIAYAEPSGDFQVYVSASNVKAGATDVYTFNGGDKQFEALIALNSAIDQKNELKVAEEFKTYAETFAVDEEEISGLSNDAKKKLGNLIIAEGTYIIPDDYDTAEKIQQITEAMKAVAKNYNKCIPVALLIGIDNATISAYLDKYKTELLNSFGDVTETPYDEAEMYDYLEKAMDYDRLYTRLNTAAADIEDAKDIYEVMLNEGILTVIEESNYTTIKAIVEKFHDLFTIDEGDFDELSDSQKTTVYKGMTDKSYIDIDDFIKKFDKKVEAVLSGNDERGGSSGGRGGSGGSRTQSGTGGVTVDSDLLNSGANSKKAFADLTDFEWAEEAIYALYEKNVVSGKTEGVFDPNANVTRAEFIKMTVIALNVPNREYAGEFEDVSVDDWYAPYIAAATKAGIVTGSDGMVYPNDSITREDMATILYRAKGFTPSENERDVFYDSDGISDYAKSPVFVLYEKGMVKGVGEGMFAPKLFANRAEAAQMIYNISK